MSDAVRSWHHGLVARWWDEFNRDEDDVPRFRALIERSGEPVLDAGCGAGRLLLPLRRAGFDVDGSDASEDMIALCRSRADAEDLVGNLYVQPMHALDLPREYGTILVCGAFGLGGSRADDLEGLRRIRHHLTPGGLLALDHYLPYLESPRTWKYFVEEPALPKPWPEQGDRRRAADGSELELRVRQLAFDPLAQATTLEIRASELRDGVEVATETGSIDINLYLAREIELMLAAAGFQDVELQAFAEPRPPDPWKDARVLFLARG